MVEDLVVEGEVIAGDDIDTGILLDLPVGQTKALGLLEELSLGELSTPVFPECQSIKFTHKPPKVHRLERAERIAKLTSLGGLLQVTVDTLAGETENSRLDHFANVNVPCQSVLGEG